MKLSAIKKFKFKKRYLLIPIVLLILFSIGKSILFPPQKVTESTVVKKGEIKQEVTLSGKIDAQEHVILQFATGGKLSWVGVKEGDFVKPGQILAYLDKQILEAALRQARQDFTAAQAPHEKYYDNHTDDPESYDDKITRTTLDATQNKAYDNVRIAEENLKNATLYSPIEGIVTRVDSPYAGVNIYAPTQAQFEIFNPNTVIFSVSADQTDVVNLKVGQTGEIVLDSYPERTIKSVIKSISFAPRTDETGTVYEVIVNIADQDISAFALSSQQQNYKLGMTGDITFTTKQKSDVLSLPLSFIKSDTKGKYVLTGKDKQKTYIKTGIETDNEAEILQGLLGGETVYD